MAPVVITPMYTQFNSEHHGRLPIFQSWKTAFQRYKESCNRNLATLIKTRQKSVLSCSITVDTVTTKLTNNNSEIGTQTGKIAKSNSHKENNLKKQ